MRYRVGFLLKYTGFSVTLETLLLVRSRVKPTMSIVWSTIFRKVEYNKTTRGSVTTDPHLTSPHLLCLCYYLKD